MARIRTIKPEFCTSEQVANCSPNARLLFILMWLHCDDFGNHPAKAVQLKMECFPADSFSKEDVLEMVNELLSSELIEEYQVNGDSYWHITGWDKHQRIDRPSQKYPREPKQFDEPSTSPRRVFDEHSTNDQRALDEPSTSPRPGKERKGKEGSRKESNGKEGGGQTTAQPSAYPDQEDFIFPTKSGVDWQLPLSEYQELKKTFPSIDVDTELRKASLWLRKNPARLKENVSRYLVNWLSRAATDALNKAPPKKSNQDLVEEYRQHLMAQGVADAT